MGTLPYYLFAAAIFFFMGTGLACDAKHHAEAAADWERLVHGAAGPWRSRSRLEWAYRIGGAVFSAFGLLVAAAALWSPQALSARLPLAVLAGLPRFASGLLLAAIGLLLVSFKLGELAKSAALPAGLEDLLGDRKADWGRRLASLSGWLVALCFFGFGLFLVSRRG